MTLDQLKNNPGYYFECYIDGNKYVNCSCCDDWNVCFASLWNDIAVEYNICIDDNENCSAIYYVRCYKDGAWETDYDRFISCEIDFSKDNWRSELENAMCIAMIEFMEGDK